MELNYRKKFQDNSWFLNEILIFIKATYQKCDSTRMVKILEGKRLISDQILTVLIFSIIKKVFDNFLILTKIFKGFTLFMILIFGFTVLHY